MNPEQKNAAIRKVTGINRDDFYSSLEAMHEAEKVLTYKQRVMFVTRFKAQSALGSMLDLQKATASQRADAFLLTIGEKI